MTRRDPTIPPTTAAAGSLASAASSWLLLGVAAVLALPALRSISLGLIELAEGSDRASLPPGTLARDALTLVRSTGLALAIGALATLLAAPAGFLIGRLGGRARARALAASALPLLLPSYLSYAAWNLLRAPGSPISDWIASGPAWMPVLAGRLIGWWGVVLWLWPIPALVLAASASRLDPAALDALRQHPAGLWRRARFFARWLGPGLLAGWFASSACMLGSAVPLHVAQIDTIAIVFWRELALAADPNLVWARALPLLAVVAVLVMAAGALASRALRQDPARDLAAVPSAAGRAPPGPLAWSAGLWVLSVVVPAFLLLRALTVPPGWPSASTLAGASERFWRESGAAAAISLASAAALGVLLALLAALAYAAWGLEGDRQRSAPRARPLAGLRDPRAWALSLALLSALSPGVLVGAGWLDLLTHLRLDPLLDTPAGVVLAHGSRFGVLALALGWWLAATEPSALRDARLLAGPRAIRAWRRASLRPATGLLAGLALCCMSLSLHEIESAVLLQPPGMPGLAQTLLDQLHFARDDRLAAGVLNLLAPGAVLAWIGAAVLARGLPRGRG